jgi:ATP-dependent Clp protease ATP-binding subunit ClpA
MRRAVERFLEDPLAEEILRGSLIGGEPIKVSVKDDKLTFKQKASTETEEETVSASE